jgi:hypothetical protein
MLLMQGNVAFAAHDRDRPESDDVRSDAKNGINSGSNISDFPALSRMKTTVRKCFAGVKARACPAALLAVFGAIARIAASNKTSGTTPSAIEGQRLIRRRIYEENSATPLRELNAK